ncbi:MAG: hypothetical protein WKF58_14855 [Ilumatobacteraceae bacterium]
MKRRLLTAAAAVTLLTGFSGCTNEQLARMAVQRYFPARQENNAMSVARCESGYRADAVSPDGANHGLFQINNVHRHARAVDGLPVARDLRTQRQHARRPPAVERGRLEPLELPAVAVLDAAQTIRLVWSPQ